MCGPIDQRPQGLGRHNLNSLSGTGKPFDSAAKKDDKKNNYNNHNYHHNDNWIQLQHTRNDVTIGSYSDE